MKSIYAAGEIAVGLLAMFIGGLAVCIILLEVTLSSVGVNSAAITLFLGLIIWLWIFFFGGIAERCFKIVPDNQAWIIANRLKQEKVPSGGAINRDRTIRAQRAIQSGFNLTWPWEYVALGGGVIDMTKQSLGKEDDSDSYSTKDKNQVDIEYEFFWAVIPGEEVNHFRFRQLGGNEEKIAAYLRGLYRGWLQGYCIEHMMDDLIGKVDPINAAFVSEFLVSRALTDNEKKMGVQITDGSVFRIAPTKPIKEAREIVLKAIAIADSAKTLRENDPELSQEKATHLAVTIQQGYGMEVRDESIKVSGLPAGLVSFSHGGSPSEGKPRNEGKPKKPQPPKP